MAILANPRHEAFAQALARGMSASAAYAEAGHKGQSARGRSGSCLLIAKVVQCIVGMTR
jgi:hypothetical protein